MKALKKLVDTTLRDGEQSPGYAMTLRQKVKIASILDSSGVSQIEAGIPSVGAYEQETIREIVRQKRNSLISVWCRMNSDDIKTAFRCCPDLIHIGVPVSYVQIYTKLRRNKSWLVKTMLSCADLALSSGFAVSVGFEDASRADPTFLFQLAGELSRVGIKRIRYADTVGVLNPSRTFEAVQELIQYTGAEVEFHAHNDLGMAVANSLAAAKAGAACIDTTVYGIGERAGNCSLTRFVSACEPIYTVLPGHCAALEVERKTRDILLSRRKDDSYETWN